jgi:hypothetical protein
MAHRRARDPRPLVVASEVEVKATFFNEHGGPDVLRYDDVPDPLPGPGDALVKVGAVSINHGPDTLGVRARSVKASSKPSCLSAGVRMPARLLLRAVVVGLPADLSTALTRARRPSRARSRATPPRVGLEVGTRQAQTSSHG